MDLFENRKKDFLAHAAPLADRMRPRTLDEFIGQEHIIGDGRLLRRAIQIDQLSSLIFYGPPGTGKTTLARIIANTTKAQFLSINAVLAGVKEIRESIDTAQKTLSLYGRRTILFVDEVHRFNKSQQDALLPHVENGIVILIGATTENPYFEVNKALVSRSRIFQLRQLTDKALRAIALQAMNDKERGYGNKKVLIDDDALDHLVKVANGDARGVLNALELAVETTQADFDGAIHIDRSIAEESIQQRAVLYDKDGDAHYDTISAFIKSVRGSDPDAALYWMAKMIYAGEDPRFIFRRMLILACEDVGMADPKALGVVVDAAQAFDYVGLPEGRYHLAHACIYLATAPKSNSSMAFFDALNVISKEVTEDIPNHLRDASRDKEGFGHGEGYLYPHAYRDHWVAQQYLPEALQGKIFYQPSDQGYERGIKDSVAGHREAQLEAMVEQDDTNPLFRSRGKLENSSVDSWLERSVGSRGRQMGWIRERVLELCSLKRHNLFLDLNARTGLLTFAAARVVTEGGVWVLAHDDKAFSTLTKMAAGFDALTRPQIIRTSWDEFEKGLYSSAGPKVVFDAIAGRNVLMKQKNKLELFGNISRFLSDAGRIVLAESIPSEGQRISDLLDCSRIDGSIADSLREVEQGLFTDNSDPMVNWDSESIKELFTQFKDLKMTFDFQVDKPVRKILPEDIEFWFREDDTQRVSLGKRLAAVCGDTKVEELKRIMHRQFDYKEVEWKTVTMFVVAENAD